MLQLVTRNSKIGNCSQIIPVRRTRREKKVFKGLRPKIIWDLFEDITQIPRESKKEEKIRSWIKSWAVNHNLPYREDKIGNILLSTDASNGCEHYRGVILQAHLDMVCQKDPGSAHDFDNDPIPVKIVDDYVTAEGTTLGADNGIGIAVCLATLIDPHLKHGPIEVLLTVDEETGLTGAFALESNFFSHNLLLNLDSEDEGEITISSAGGGGTKIVLPINREKKTSLTGFKLTVGGLTGGHSGIDIHKSRLNAIKVLVEGLINIRQKVDVNFHICSINSDGAHNSIPRDAHCEFLVDNTEAVKQIFKEWIKQIETYRKYESKIKVDLQEMSIDTCMTSSNAIITLLYEIPHGPLSYSKNISDLVETSNNLATVRTTPTTVEIVVSNRSSNDEELNRVRSELKELGERVDAEVYQGPAYPGWQPELDSQFLGLVKQEYEREYGKEVKLKAIHAGLETGLFKGINPRIQLVSIGPEMKDVHSPQERVYIKSVDLLWRVVKAVLTKLDQI